MKIRIYKGTAKGQIYAPASKSMAHRLIISAGLCEGVSTIRGISDCQDVLATLDCLNALGVKTETNGNDVTICGNDIRKAIPKENLECRESGSTLRFIIPIAMLSGNKTTLHGAQSLMKRPMTIYEDVFGDKYKNNVETITVCGPLKSGEYVIPGNVSSQFISGLLFALPLVEGDSVIKITPPVESRSYINLTINAIKLFGIKAEWKDENTILIFGAQTYTPADVTVEGDYSGAAFPESLNLFGGDVKVLGLDENSAQGDRVHKEYFELLNRENATIDISDCPDLAPILFSVAAAKHGGTFLGTKRLKIKESDRAQTMAEELRKFGATVNVYENSVKIVPTNFHAPSGILYGHNDHRVVMSLAILLTLTGGEIDGAEAITKSYPNFFENLKKLGIGVEEI